MNQKDQQLISDLSQSARYLDESGQLGGIANNLNEAISRLTELLNPWQPIETAPKGGRRILCWDPTESGTYVVLRWNGCKEGWESDVDPVSEWEPTEWMLIPYEEGPVPVPPLESREADSLLRAEGGPRSIPIRGESGDTEVGGGR